MLFDGKNFVVRSDEGTVDIVCGKVVLYVRNQSSGGGGGDAVWGDITGTLANQTDLKNALDNKADESAIAEEWVSGNAYFEGTLMTHEGKLYKAIQNFQATTWDANSVQEITVNELIAGKADSASLGTMATVNDAPSNGNEYVRKNGAWAIASGGGGGGGTAAWGSISGTLSDQTDLQNALDTKANAADLGDLADHDTVDYATEVTNKPTLGTMSAVNDAPSNGSEYVRKNGQWAVASGGGSGSASWGSITGTLSSQTDLQNALNAKADASAIADEWVANQGYVAGSVMMHNGKLYKATSTFVAADWDLSYVQEITIEDLLAEKQNALTFDSAPTASSTNPVTSGGVATALSAKANSADLGSLATKSTVDYSTEVTNKPTLGDLADHDTVNYATEVTNKPTLGGIQVRPDYRIEPDTTSTIEVGDTLATGTLVFIYEAS